MRIAIAGGSGCLGRLIVETVQADGDEPVVLSRRHGVDLTSGAGLEQALTGASVVIDVSNVVTITKGKSVKFFQAAGEHLLAAEQRAGVTHHVALSIVGADRVDYGYYFGKRKQEELALGGPVPATVLRATQFHEFATQMLARGPVVVAPKMVSQPIAAREVARALVDLAHREPAGLAPDLAGPRREDMPDMIRRVAKAHGSHRPVLTMRLPGAAGKDMADGALLPSGEATYGTQSFAEWLTTPDARWWPNAA